MTDQPETARALLWRHHLPEDVIDGVLCLHAQELAAVQRREAAVWGIDTAAGKRILGAADLIDPTRTNIAPAAVLPSTDRAIPSRRAGLREALRRAVCEAEGFAWDSDMLEPDEYGDHVDAVLAVLYREWPWLRVEAEDAADPARCTHSFPDPYPQPIDEPGDCRGCGITYQEAKRQHPVGMPVDRAAVIRWCATKVRSTDSDYAVQQAAEYLDDLALEAQEQRDEGEAQAHLDALAVLIPEPDVDRAAGLLEAADAIATRQDLLDAEERAEFGELDHETVLEGKAVRRMADYLRRLAAEAPVVETPSMALGRASVEASIRDAAAEVSATVCAECGHPSDVHTEGEDPVSPGRCTACPADGEEWHNYQTAEARATAPGRRATCPAREPLLGVQCTKEAGHDHHSDRPSRIWYPVTDDEPAAEARGNDGQDDEAPRRGDQLEAWLKAQRDLCFGHAGPWGTVDGLLDQYRLHADTGTPLDRHVCEGQAVGDCECLEAPAVVVEAATPADTQTREAVHGCPPDGSGLTPCCGRTPFELPRTDRISSEAPVTCVGTNTEDPS